MNTWPPVEAVDNQRQCQSCGAHVSASFRRLYGDESGTVHACPDCSTLRDLEYDALDDGDRR